MMPILHSSGVSTPGQFGPISRDLRPLELGLHPHHVEHRDALGDADDQRDFRVDRLLDRAGGAGRRHIYDGGIGAGPLLRLGDGGKDRQRCSLRDLAGPELAALLRVRRRRPSWCRNRRAPARCGTCRSCRSGPGTMTLVSRSTRMDISARPADRRDDLLRRVVEIVRRRHIEPAFVRGCASPPPPWCLPGGRPAAPSARPPSPRRRTPSAIVSQRMMPPKMLTRMPFTFGSAVMILNAAVTFSLARRRRRRRGSSPARRRRA